LPASLVSSTVNAAGLYGAGQTAGAVSIELVALTQGVLKAMSMNKVRTVAAVLLMAGVVVLGGGLVCRHTAAAGQPEVQQEKPPVGVAEAGQKGKPAASAAVKGRKDRLEVRADGKQVQVRVVRGDEEFQAVADRMSSEEGSKRLVLEGNVRLRQRRQGKEIEEVQGQKMVIDRKTGTVKVEGVGLAVPALGPAPVALDFGFPTVKGQNQFRGAGQEGKVYLVPFVDAGTLGEKQGPPKRPEGRPADAGTPAMRKELDELRERVKKLEKRLSDAAAAAKDFQTAEFYRRTGHPGSASFYYEAVSRRHPHTPYADEARRRLGDLRKQVGS
jgi:hypothetical protein